VSPLEKSHGHSVKNRAEKPTSDRPNRGRGGGEATKGPGSHRCSGLGVLAWGERWSKKSWGRERVREKEKRERKSSKGAGGAALRNERAWEKEKGDNERLGLRVRVRGSPPLKNCVPLIEPSRKTEKGVLR